MRLTVLLTLVVAAVAACGGSAAPTAPASARPTASAAASAAAPSGSAAATQAPAGTPAGNAGTLTGDALCKLITEADVAAAMGQPVTRTYADPEACNWDVQDNSSIQFRADTTGIDSARVAFPDGQDVPGIGDEAYFQRTAGITFVKGGATYSIQLVSMGPERSSDVRLAIVSTLAKKALAAGL